jgi:hypothetical protein
MSEEREANVYVVEQVEISSDSDTEELLEDLGDLEDLQNSLADIGQLDSLMRSTLRRTITPGQEEQENKVYQPKHVRRLEVVDDFIRNFLTKNNMTKTLNSFQVSLSQRRNNGMNASKEKRYPTQKSKTKSSKIRFNNFEINYPKQW